MSDLVAKYCVIGNPIAHSKSPTIHKMFAEQVSHNLNYDRQLFEIDGFAAGVSGLVNAGFSGANVTVPFKQNAWQLAQHKSTTALIAGAVNTLSFKDGEIVGDNTDGVGLVRDLLVNHKQQIADRKILILGAGGAVRGVLQDILNAQPESITIANRTLVKAEELVEIFSSQIPVNAVQYLDLNQPFDLIINGTSASLNNELPPVPEIVVKSDTVTYDMMYVDGITVFNQWAQSNGANCCIDGLGMLIEQAAESFRIWRGVRPDTQPVIEMLRASI